MLAKRGAFYHNTIAYHGLVRFLPILLLLLPPLEAKSQAQRHVINRQIQSQKQSPLNVVATPVQNSHKTKSEEAFIEGAASMQAEPPTTFRAILRDEEQFKRLDETSSIARDSPLLPESCDRSDDSALLARLKDSGLYAEIYMAPDIHAAADQFPDLGDTLRFTTAKGEYFCDNDCQYNARFVRSIMKGENHGSVIRKSSSMSYAHSQSESWWHEENWNVEQYWRKRRHIDTEVERLLDTTVDSGSGREESSINELNSNITKSVSAGNFQSGTTSGRVTKPFTEVDIDNENGTGTDEKASERQRRVQHRLFSKRQNRRQRRESINELGTLIRVNSGISKGILGTTVALECDDPDQSTLSTKGYHMCKTCRAVRQLPEGYFPRVLNEVICAEDICLHGEGACRQRFLPFKVANNLPQFATTTHVNEIAITEIVMIRVFARFPYSVPCDLPVASF